MNFKTTIVLVAVLVVVGAIWLLTPSAEQEQPEPVETTGTTNAGYVFDPQPERDKIVRVEIERPDQPRLVFERIADEEAAPGQEKWRMVEPLATAVEPHAVRGLLSTFVHLQSRATFEPGAEGQPTAAEAGLEPPVATVKLVDEDGAEYALEIGKLAVMSTDTYVRIAGEQTVHVAKRDLQPELRKKIDDYRSKRLADLSINDAVWAQIEHEGTTYTFSRGDDGEWVIEEPVRAHAVREKVRSLITRLNTLRALEFVDDLPPSLATYGLEPPYLTIAVTTETKKELPADEATGGPETQPAEPEYEIVRATHRLLVGGFADLKSENRYVKSADEPWVATVTQAAVSGLVPNLKELRDPRVTLVKAADITSLEIVSGGQSATLKKTGGTWQGSGDLADLDTAAVTDLLDAFADIEAIDYVAQPDGPGAYGLDEPRAEITVTAAGSVEPITLRIGDETASGRNAYVQRAGDPTAIVTSAAQANRLAVNLLALRSRAIFNYPVEQLRRITVERPAMRYELVREDKQWRLVEPAAPIDAASVRALANDLTRLRAKQVVGTGNDAAYGLERPATTAMIRFEVASTPPSTQPAETPEEVVAHTLRIGRKDNVAYARKDDEPYVFELDETVFNVMIAELINPQLFTFKPDEVVGVKIVSTGGTLELAREGEQWKYTPDPFVELSQKKVNDFINEISQMRAEAYFAYRDGDLEAEQLTHPQVSVTIRLAGDKEILMHMTQELPGELPRKAALVAQRRIFRLRQADCEKLLRGLGEYVQGG